MPAERADLLHAVYDRINVAGRRIVSVRLTPSAYAHGLALALPTEVALARPTGVGRALATCEIPIEGRDELAPDGAGAIGMTSTAQAIAVATRRLILTSSLEQSHDAQAAGAVRR